MVIVKVISEDANTVCVQDEYIPVEVREDVHIKKEVVGVSLTSSPLCVESDGEGHIYIS